MDIYKDEGISKAIRESVISFGKKNDFNGLDYFAEQFEFKGTNRSAQFYNHIHHKNLQKDLKIGMLLSIMDQMDEEETYRICSALCNKYGFYAARGEQSNPAKCVNIESSITIGAFDIGNDYGVLSDEMAQDLKDGKIDEAEAKRIKKILTSLRKKARSVEDIIDEHILG